LFAVPRHGNDHFSCCYIAINMTATVCSQKCDTHW